jgi:hypothetical protein
MNRERDMAPASSRKTNLQGENPDLKPQYHIKNKQKDLHSDVLPTQRGLPWPFLCIIAQLLSSFTVCPDPLPKYSSKNFFTTRPYFMCAFESLFASITG